MYALATQWRESGLSKKEFCRVHNLSFHQFYYWEKKQRKTNNDLNSSEVNFFSISTPAHQASIGSKSTEIKSKKVLSIELVNGIKIDFY